MCKEAAGGVRMQCGWGYFLENEWNPRAAQLYTMSCLAKFDYLGSLSASHSNKNFKAKRIGDDLMFSSVESEAIVLRKTVSIIKDLQSMKVM